jgi:hypothetical protein
MQQTTTNNNASAATTAKPYTAGTQTGSLMNYIFSGAKMAAPEIGMGATVLMWSDRHAATIVEVSKSGKRVGIAEDEAKRVDGNGMSDSQSYEYSPGTGSVQYFTLRKNGAWVREGDSMKGARLAIGARQHYYDFSF